MSKLTIFAKLSLAVYLISTFAGCHLLPQSECELTEADGQNILGISVVSIDKTNSAFGDSSKSANDKHLRACGYVPKNQSERGNLYWAQTESESLEESKRLFGIVTEKLSEIENYSSENLPELGEEAKLSRFQNGDSGEMKIAVRKGKNVILITISKPLTDDIPVEEVKSLAKRLADKTGG